MARQKYSKLLCLTLLVSSPCPFKLAAAAARAGHGAARRLQEDGGVRVADFTSLFTHPMNDIEMFVGESQLSGTMNVTSSSSEQSPSGTYHLAPTQIQQLDETILGQLVRFSLHVF